MRWRQPGAIAVVSCSVPARPALVCHWAFDPAATAALPSLPISSPAHGPSKTMRQESGGSGFGCTCVKRGTA